MKSPTLVNRAQQSPLCVITTKTTTNTATTTLLSTPPLAFCLTGQFCNYYKLGWSPNVSKEMLENCWNNFHRSNTHPDSQWWRTYRVQNYAQPCWCCARRLLAHGCNSVTEVLSHIFHRSGLRSQSPVLVPTCSSGPASKNNVQLF